VESLDEAGIRRLAGRCRDASRPGDDVHATAEWRRAMVEVLVTRALRQAAAGGGLSC
jgi:CO/xanthine dehydrogenase FAD-binding subunit